MNLNLGMDHQVNMSQQLNLAPQLLHWLKLLQSSTTELSSLVQHELESNPALEAEIREPSDMADEPVDTRIEAPAPAPEADIPEGSDFEVQDDMLAKKYEFLAEIDEEWKDDSMSSSKSFGAAAGSDEDEKYQHIFDSISNDGSLQDHLLKQIPLSGLSKADVLIGAQIVGSIDERGYLSNTVEEIAATAETTMEKVTEILSVIQTFEPAGVAARDLRECLLLQMDASGKFSTARLLVESHMEALARKQYQEIALALNVTEEEVLAGLRLIQTLNPAPGKAFTRDNLQYITPDVTVVRSNGSLVVELNDSNIPHLRISSSCRQLMSKTDITSEEQNYMRNKIRSAAFLIQGINQRQDTLRKVADQILLAQKEFLDTKDGLMKPLTMAKVAEMIGVHETTVSRALANKHIKTPRGLFEMRHFFRTGYHCNDGSAVTPDVVKDLIVELIENENACAPLKDAHIVKMLEKKGLKLARRTIAKYREELNIESSKERKKKAVPGKQPSKMKTVTPEAISIAPAAAEPEQVMRKTAVA